MRRQCHVVKDDTSGWCGWSVYTHPALVGFRTLPEAMHAGACSFQRYLASSMENGLSAEIIVLSLYTCLFIFKFANSLIFFVTLKSVIKMPFPDMRSE